MRHDFDPRADDQKNDRVGEKCGGDAPERMHVLDDGVIVAQVLEPAVGDAAAERGENPRLVQTLGGLIGTVRDEHAADHVQIAVDAPTDDEVRDGRDHDSHDGAPQGDGDDGPGERKRLDRAAPFERQRERGVEHHGDAVVEQRLTLDDDREAVRHREAPEGRDDGDGIGGRDDRAEQRARAGAERAR